MKFVLVHTDVQDFKPLQSIVPSALIPAMIKPILQHQLELAYEGGVRDCVVIASDGLEKIRRFCGDGSRFGLALELYSGVPSGQEIPSLTKHPSLFKHPFAMISGNVQVTCPMSDIQAEHEASGAHLTVLKHSESGDNLAYVCSPSAWSLFKGRKGSIEGLLASLANTDDTAKTDDTGIRIAPLDVPYLKCSNLPDVLTLNKKLLGDQSGTAFSSLRELESGVFVGHHVLVDPKASIRPPVAIGDFSHVMAGATVGPNVVIGNESIVGRKATIRNSVIGNQSFIGELTQVKNSIVVGASLINLESGVRVVVTDSFLLDKVSSASFSDAADSLVNRAVALGVLGALAPVWAAINIVANKKGNESVELTETVGNGDVSNRDDVDYLPRFQKLSAASGLPMSWYPTLLNVLKGQMRIVGPEPVSPEQARTMEGIGTERRFAIAPGLVPVGDIFDDQDEIRMAEILYTKNKSLSRDARILLARILLSILGKSKAVRLAGL